MLEYDALKTTHVQTNMYICTYIFYIYYIGVCTKKKVFISLKSICDDSVSRECNPVGKLESGVC